MPFIELEREIQAIKAAGELMRYKEIVPPVPPSLDAAKIYLKAFHVLPKLSKTEQQAFDNFLFGRPSDKTQVRRILKRAQSALALAKRAKFHMPVG
ncbi:MAG: hypothetical protein RMK18_06370 [Armatimonadota bacterium]|nr:hypothetical protein [Armatimonadota bacterium]MDW8025471.1 hypothetical protein [Armatimonadota bacterium]